MKNNGELLQPPTDLRDVTPQLEAGGEYAWKPEARRWRILVAPPADCGDPCRELARELDLVWRLFGNKADELDLLWLGAPPEGATRNAATLVLSPDPALRAQLRSEEHTSELQSLMRISYAVFCLKKKTQHTKK